MEKKWIYIGLGVAAFVIIFYFVYQYLVKMNNTSSPSPSPTTQQAAILVAVPSPTPVPTKIPLPSTQNYDVLYVSPLSYLANYNGQHVTVASTPPQIQIGDSYWVGFNLRNGMLVLEPLPQDTAQQLSNQKLLIPNKTLKVKLVYTQPSSDLNMQSAAYASYGTNTTTLTAGILRSLMRNNKSVFKKLFQALLIDNYPIINQVISSLSGNPQLQSIVKTLSIPGNLVAPLAITYNAAMTLGIVPPEIQQYITSPNKVVIDFGYV